MGRCLPQVSGSDKGLMSDKKVNALFRFKSLRATILIPFLMIVISTILIFMLISVSRSREMALGTSTDYTGQLIDMANSDIDSYFSNMENIAQLILGSDDTINYLTYSEADHYKADYNNCLTRLEQQFTTLRETRDENSNIINQEFISTIGLHLGFLFSASTGEDNRNVFAPTFNLSLLDFQLGLGYELGTLLPDQKLQIKHYQYH